MKKINRKIMIILTTFLMFLSSCKDSNKNSNESNGNVNTSGNISESTSENVVLEKIDVVSFDRYLTWTEIKDASKYKIFINDKFYNETTIPTCYINEEVSTVEIFAFDKNDKKIATNTASIKPLKVDKNITIEMPEEYSKNKLAEYNSVTLKTNNGNFSNTTIEIPNSINEITISGDRISNNNFHISINDRTSHLIINLKNVTLYGKEGVPVINFKSTTGYSPYLIIDVEGNNNIVGGNGSNGANGQRGETLQHATDGQKGKDGSSSVICSNLYVTGEGRISFIGGNGGNGGEGGYGNTLNNPGNGGNGGNGGQAVRAESVFVNLSQGSVANFVGGNGGNGGLAGKKDSTSFGSSSHGSAGKSGKSLTCPITKYQGIIKGGEMEIILPSIGKNDNSDFKGEQLTTPKPIQIGNIITWDEVPGANYYIVSFRNQEKTIVENSCYIEGLYKGGNVYIKAVYKEMGQTKSSSLWSDAIEIGREYYDEYNSMEWNVENGSLLIPANIEKCKITGANSSAKITIGNRATPLTIELYDVTAGYLGIEGNVNNSATIDQLIIIKSFGTRGNSFQGADGKDGAKGADKTGFAGTGEKGGNGQNGTSGGILNVVLFEGNNSIVFRGGRGGHGGKGGNPAWYQSNGGDGGNGGRGGDGLQVKECYLNLSDGASFNCYAGYGGEAGAAGGSGSLNGADPGSKGQKGTDFVGKKNIFENIYIFENTVIDKLETPSVVVDGYTISWDSIANADGYIISYEGKEYYTTNTFHPIFKYSENITINIKAVSYHNNKIDGSSLPTIITNYTSPIYKENSKTQQIILSQVKEDKIYVSKDVDLLSIMGDSNFYDIEIILEHREKQLLVGLNSANFRYLGYDKDLKKNNDFKDMVILMVGGDEQSSIVGFDSTLSKGTLTKAKDATNFDSLYVYLINNLKIKGGNGYSANTSNDPLYVYGTNGAVGLNCTNLIIHSNYGTLWYEGGTKGLGKDENSNGIDGLDTTAISIKNYTSEEIN